MKCKKLFGKALKYMRSVDISEKNQDFDDAYCNSGNNKYAKY